jgi:hypothetical protein
MVIGFIEHIQNVTTNNCDSVTEFGSPKITVYSAHEVSLFFTSHCLIVASSGDVPLVLCSQTVLDLSYQLLTTVTQLHPWQGPHRTYLLH